MSVSGKSASPSEIKAMQNDLEQLTVKNLKDILKNKGEPQYGLKAELVTNPVLPNRIFKQ